jgi:hypothetical protein
MGPELAGNDVGEIITHMDRDWKISRGAMAASPTYLSQRTNAMAIAPAKTNVYRGQDQR